MNKIQVVKTDEQLYEELIGKVMKINANAALYMAAEAKELGSFRYSSDLSDCFIWEDTPQGQEYWDDLWYDLYQR